MSLQKDVASDESLQGSWVELHFNGTGSQGPSHRGSQEQIPASVQEGDVEKMLLEAQRESGRNSSKGSSQCNSPLRSQTPLLLWRGSEGNSSQSDEDFQERRREVENLMKKNADWIWDWSSRPENSPPKIWQSVHSGRNTSSVSALISPKEILLELCCDLGPFVERQIKRTNYKNPQNLLCSLITHAMLPREFLLKYPKRSTSLSIRNTSVMKKGGLLSADFLKLFLPSLIISHILAIGLGIYIGKRLTTHNTY